ncbi:MAG: T9SS type A sorting domain-containing protein, partial [Saprospiraceae bacterium]
TSFCEGSTTTLSLSQNYNSYQWNDNSTLTELEVSDAGTYSVVIADDNGCTGTAEIEVTISDEIQAEIIGATSFCEGSTTTLSLSQNYNSYQWSDNSTSENLEVSQAGTYNIIVTDASGCSGTASITVNIDQVISPVIVGPLSFCEGSSASLTVSDIYDNYEWSTGANTTNVDVDVSGSYTVTVTAANGCTSTDAFETVAVGALETNQELSICFGETISVGNSTYENSGDYVDLLTSMDGCDSVVYTLLEIETELLTSESLTICHGGNYQGNTYTQDANIPFTHTSIQGCDSTHTVMLSVLDQMTAVIVSSSDCSDSGTITVNSFGGAGSHSYLWNNGATTQTQEDVPPGNYTVTITDNWGCSTTSAGFIEPGNEVSFDFEIEPISCFGETDAIVESMVVSGMPPFTYNWSTGANTSYIENAGAGNYTLLITDANGCQFASSVLIGNPNPLVIDPVTTGTTNNDGTATAFVSGGTSPYSYEWEDGQTSAVITGLGIGFYAVTVTDAHGCTTVGEAQVSTPTAVKDIEGVLAFSINPNPGSGLFNMTLETERAMDFNYSVYGISGAKLLDFEETQARRKHEATIDLTEKASGIYIVVVNAEGIRLVRKLVVSK